MQAVCLVCLNSEANLLFCRSLTFGPFSGESVACPSRPREPIEGSVSPGHHGPPLAQKPPIGRARNPKDMPAAHSGQAQVSFRSWPRNAGKLRQPGN